MNRYGSCEDRLPVCERIIENLPFHLQQLTVPKQTHSAD